ncbi:MAG: FtsQ-type POTRA domain-containing protein [Gemmatimonadota bacterium]
MAARRLKRGWYVAGGIALAVLLWFGVPPIGRSLSFFRIRRIEFNGLTHLTADRLVPMLQLSDRASLFDPVDGMESRLKTVPGIVSAVVHRRVPGTIRIDIAEAVPVALAASGSAMVLVDNRGRTLPFDPTVSAPDLPVLARPDSVIAGVLATVREVDPALFARISSAWRSRKDVVLEVDSRRYWFRPDASAEAILAVTAVAADLARLGRNYKELDGRFAGQVVVRWKAA